MATIEGKASTHCFLRFYRCVIMYIAVALLLFGMFIVSFESSFVKNAQDEYDSLCNAAQTDYDTSNANEQLTQLRASMSTNGAGTRFKVETLRYAQTQFTVNVLADFAEHFSSDKKFYFISDKTAFSWPNGNSCPLSEAQLKLLVQEGSMLEGDFYYFSARMKNGTLVMQMDDEESSESMKLEAFYSCDVLTYRVDTGEIVDVYGGELETELLGKNIGDIVLYPQIGEKIVQSDGYELLIFTPEKGVLPNLFTMVFAIRSDENLSDGLQRVFYLPVSYMIFKVLRMISAPMLMMLLFAAISIHSSIYYRRCWRESKMRGREIRLGKRLRLDTEVAKNTIFVEGCFFVLVLVIGLFVQSLADFAYLYEDAQIHLDGLITTLEKNQDVADYVEGRFKYSLQNNTDSVVTYLTEETDPEKIEAYLSQIKTIIGAEEISVYDEDGVIRYSTDSYEGYQLSKMEQDSEYRLWELINGESDSLFYEVDSENGLYCCAERRKDSIGIVAIEKTDFQIRRVKDKVDVDNTALNLDFETSDKLFVSSTNTTTLYRIPAGKNTVETLSNCLPTLEDLQQFSAIKFIGRSPYFVCGLGYGSASIYNADPVKPIITNTLQMGWRMLIVCTAISFFVVLGTCVYNEDALRRIKENAHMTNKEIKDVMHSSLYFGWLASVSLTGLFMIWDVFASDESILSFLLFGNWEKGWNIFALAMSILALVAAILMNHLLRAFFRTLIKNLSSYVVTICEMLNSMLTLVIYLWVLIYDLMQFGVDINTILAGIGISGIAISFAAKGTIEDLLSGIFLIVGGRIKVGDFIQVGDYEGEITHIGIRTTKIQRWHMETSINNSDMRNIVNCSRGEFNASFYFVVPFGTDLTRLKKIIADNASRFMENSDGILLSPPFLYGPSGFRFNGIRIQVLAQTLPALEGAAERKVYAVLAEIMKENNISIRG